MTLMLFVFVKQLSCGVRLVARGGPATNVNVGAAELIASDVDDYEICAFAAFDPQMRPAGAVIACVSAIGRAPGRPSSNHSPSEIRHGRIEYAGKREGGRNAGAMGWKFVPVRAVPVYQFPVWPDRQPDGPAYPSDIFDFAKKKVKIRGLFHVGYSRLFAYSSGAIRDPSVRFISASIQAGSR